MRQMRYGVAFFIRGGVRSIVEKVRLAEELGYDSVWLAEAQLLTPELFTLLATCLHETRRITIGPGVTTVVTRHPSVTASGLAALAELAPGRVGARFGIGGTSAHGVGLRPARLATFRRDFGFIASLLRGESARTNGLDVRLAWADPAVTRQIPLYVQVSAGPRVQRLAGELGHPVSLSLALHRFPGALQRMREGAAAAGRAFEQTPLSWWSEVCVSEDFEVIKEHQVELVATRIRGDLRRALAEDEAEIGADVEVARQLTERYNPLQHGDPRASYAQLLMESPDAMWRKWLEGRLVGTPDEVVATLRQALEYEQVCEVIVGPRQPTARLSVEQLLETFARQVRPRVEAASQGDGAASG
jgi:alkanesulfonate monooxygenase SsuD/methylene tetrahydromethanopterin reductase-like flavin-dependent oxidoreductase (luciferase family)